MPRSSRHQSSKHSSRDARDYSDSEKDSSLKERKVKEESSSRVSKESSADKRKLDSKDAKDTYGTGNGDYSDGYGSSKKRKERAVDDGVSDRWNGGEEDRGEGSRKSKTSSDSKSKRKEESEGKHRESSRKDRESGAEGERKGKEGKSDRLVDNEEERSAKHLKEITDSKAGDTEPENQLGRRIRRRRDGSGDGNKHLDDVGDTIDKRLSSKDDISKDGKHKDEKHKDERYKDKYQENLNWDSKHRDDKQRDERLTKDHSSSRSDEKHSRDDKDMTENRPKKSKPLDHDRDQEIDREHDLEPSHDRVHDRYQDCESERDRDQDRDRGRSRNRDRDQDRDDDRDWDRDRDRDRNRDRDKDRERGRDRERNRDRERDRERDLDHDGSHLDDRSARYKDNRGRKRSPDDRDDFNDYKSRVIKAHYSDMENKPLSSNRTESETDRGRSHSRQVHVDSSSNRRISPSADEYRYFKSEESKYRDSVTEHRSKAISSREASGFSGMAERSSKYRYMDKPIKMDDGHPGELLTERSSSSKASPMSLVEKSPSSTSIERRHTSRSGVRRNLDVEETGRRSIASIEARDFFATEDRLTRDLPLEKPLGDDSSQADSSFYNRNNDNNSPVPPLPGFRAGIDSPSYMGTLEDDRRFNSISRYKRSGDSNLARGHANAWRGVPNWSSPMPNGFMPFQHGPPHGGFQAMMPQFPSPPLFGVRPSMEINHAGIPYHISDTDRFSGHLRPLGWQNMMDGSVPSHLHGWDGNNGVFRDEPHMYGAPDWDQNRHPMNRRGWESSAEMWKGQNGDVNKDLPTSSQKEDFPMQVMEDEISAGLTAQKSQHEHIHVGLNVRDVEARPSVTSATETSKSQLKVIKEKTSDPSKRSSYNDVARCSRVYLSKLDISRELAYPELYSQCMRLLDMDEEATVEDSKISIYMKDGERVRLKVSLASQSSLSPAIKDTVFQRAMDLYKKHRIESRVVPIGTGELVDVMTATSPQIGDDDILKHNTDEQVLTSDVEMTDAVLSTCDEQKAEAVATAGIKEEADRILALSPVKLEVAIEADNHEKPEEALPMCSSGTNDEMSCEVVKSEGGDKDCLSGPNDSILGVGACGDGKMNGVKSNYDELGCSGMNGPVPLFSSDGSSSKALKPESNESVVLSRIHHSPESTH